MNWHFAGVRLHPGSYISRFLLVCIVLGVAIFATAQQSGGPSVISQAAATDDQSGTIDAVVTDVQGDTLTLEGGLVLDISKARVHQYTEGFLDRSLIKPGMTIRASVTSPGDASAPLVAEAIRIRVPNEIVLSGLLQEVDVDVDEDKLIRSGFITLLNRRLRIFRTQTLLKRKHLKVGQPVSVVVLTNGTDAVVAAIFPDAGLPAIFP
jgi:hypothetical protein